MFHGMPPPPLGGVEHAVAVGVKDEQLGQRSGGVGPGPRGGVDALSTAGSHNGILRRGASR